MPGVAEEVRKMHEAVTEFKASMDVRMKALEKNGSAPADLEEKIDKAMAGYDEIKDTLDKRLEEERRQKLLGQNVGGTGTDPEVRQKILSFLRSKGGVNAEEALKIITKGLNETVAAEGGFLVAPHIGAMIDANLEVGNPMRQLAAVEQISTSSWEAPYDNDDVEGGWVGELEDRPETSTPTPGMLRIVVEEQQANPWCTLAMLEDAVFNIESWLTRKIARKFRSLEASAFVNGNGKKKPRGFLRYDTASLASRKDSDKKLAYAASGAAAGFSAENKGDVFIDLATKGLKSEYLANANWQMNRSTLATVRKFKVSYGGTDDGYLWQPSFVAGTPSTLLGYPVVPNDEMPAVAAGAFPVAFGDFRSGYTIIDRMILSIMRNPYKVSGKMYFDSRRRLGGGVSNFEAITLLKIANS